MYMYKPLLVFLLVLFLSIALQARDEIISGERNGLIQNTFSLKWTLDQVRRTIRYEINAKTTGWVGLGFTAINTKDADGLMRYSDLYVVSFSDDARTQPFLALYHGKNNNTRPYGPITQDVSHFAGLISAKIVDGTSINAIIERNLDAIDPVEGYDFQSIVDGPMIMLVAYDKGDNIKFGYHAKNRQAFTLNHYDPGFLAPKLYNPQVIFGTKKVNDVLAFSWMLDKNTRKLYIEYRCRTITPRSWCGIGLSPTGSMAAAILAVSFPATEDGSNPARTENYYADNNARPDPASGAVFQLVSSHFNIQQNVTSFTISRSLDPITGSTQQDRPIVNARQILLWAMGRSEKGDFDYHDKNNRGTFAVNFFDPNNDGGDGGDVLRIVLMYSHGITMTLSWAIFASLGIFIARFSKNAMPVWWMRWHIITFVCGVALTVAGFILALAMSNWSLNLTTPHTLIGFIILIGSFIQPVIGVIADRLFNPSRTAAPVFPDQLHWYVGRVLWIMGLVNIYLGLELVNAHFMIKVVYYFWVVFLISVFVFNQKPEDKHVEMANKRNNNEEETSLIAQKY